MMDVSHSNSSPGLSAEPGVTRLGARNARREAHAHIASHGEALSMLSLAECKSVDDCLERISRLADESRRGRATPGKPAWARAFGARVESWREARWPTLAELDRATGDVACVVMSFDHHSACANSAAMKAAALRAGDVVPSNGVVCVDDLGAATGVLLEQAAYQGWDAAPEPSIDEREAHMLSALADLSRHGYREVHDMLSQAWLGPALRKLEDAGRLPVDSVWLYPIVDEFPIERQAWESERVRIAGAKLFADGTLNSRTALMLHDYVDPIAGMSRGQAMVEPRQVEWALRTVSEATSEHDAMAARGHLAVHAIGDGAVRMVLDAIERVRPRPDAMGITARIEHCELIDPSDVPRFAELGVVCSVQPCHLLYDIEALRRYLPHRLERVLPLRELIDSGCKAGTLEVAERRERAARGGSGRGEIWFGSDVPIVRPDAQDSVQAATKRRRVEMTEPQGIAMAQAISEEEAWACFT